MSQVQMRRSDPAVTRWAAALLVMVLPAAAVAQGNLSTQGFGYPTGGLSARALASGGAWGEFDARSARNPAAVALGYRSGLYFQSDPEYRSVTSGSGRDRTVTPRFATLGIVFPVKANAAIGLSTHNMLDRTWETVIRSGQILGPDSIGFVETNRSSGGINETRFSLGWARLDGRLAVGTAMHVVTGENRLVLRREFDDSLRYGTLSRDLVLAYSGTGASVGVVGRPVEWLTAAASFRRGGTMHLRVVDTLRSEASVPSRFGASIRVEAIPGVSLLAGLDKTRWSDMNGLGSTSAKARDVTERSLGAEFLSARARRGLDRVYSLGYRTRELPFLASGRGVKESFLSTGLSQPFARGRANVDIAAQRATRDAAGTVTERAWLFSVGLAIRP